MFPQLWVKASHWLIHVVQSKGTSVNYIVSDSHNDSWSHMLGGGLNCTALCRPMRWLNSLSKLSSVRLKPHPYGAFMQWTPIRNLLNIKIFQDDVEISITDSQSLDRLSLQSQEDLDDINIEKYLQTAGRAAGWAKDFDCLLSDKIGLSKFTEFLQKEFSHENIYFWCSCEKYKMQETGEARLKLAQVKNISQYSTCCNQ